MTRHPNPPKGEWRVWTNSTSDTLKRQIELEEKSAFGGCSLYMNKNMDVVSKTLEQSRLMEDVVDDYGSSTTSLPKWVAIGALPSITPRKIRGTPPTNSRKRVYGDNIHDSEEADRIGMNNISTMKVPPLALEAMTGGPKLMNRESKLLLIRRKKERTFALMKEVESKIKKEEDTLYSNMERLPDLEHQYKMFIKAQYTTTNRKSFHSRGPREIHRSERKLYHKNADCVTGYGDAYARCRDGLRGSHPKI
jgi:hypothetical protein